MTTTTPNLPAPVDSRPAFLTRTAPLVDTIGDRWVAYLGNNVAQGQITKAELGVFIEICATYQLDPFAKEAWCAKSKSGKLLIMVGRDGLRKIAARNGLHVDCDVVRENDDFRVVRTSDGNRSVEHSYGKQKDRGAVIGAWSEVRKGGPKGDPMGFFYAPLEEFKPERLDSYSPWSKQESIMILAAAERQSIRQATPLGGILSEGEFESADALSTGIGNGHGDGSDPGWGELSEEVYEKIEKTIDQAEARGFFGLNNLTTVKMQLRGMKDEDALTWLGNAEEKLREYDELQKAQENIADVEVVGDSK
jgi:hypothetical protein